MSSENQNKRWTLRWLTIGVPLNYCVEPTNRDYEHVTTSTEEEAILNLQLSQRALSFVKNIILAFRLVQFWICCVLHA